MPRSLKSLTVSTIFLGVGWLLATPVAKGQVNSPFDNASSRYSAADTIGKVSPYLNLGVTADGLSNYQTLVRPLIEERESLNRQWAALDQLNQQVRGSSQSAAPNRFIPRTGPSARFMHYSHYYNMNP